ncbi:ABC transporter permease [Streptomyces sp. NPDC057099]|uniref:ABC transporter permease n=1 Tax=Streptomyces sp. NPDC057099 TaxID=3346019 RepID=UPI003632E7DC
MTAVTAGAPVAAQRLTAPRGLVLAMLRVHRSALLFWLMLTAVGIGTLLWAAGPGADAALAEYRALGCEEPIPVPDCRFPEAANTRYQTAVAIASGLLALLPVLTAAWAGGALTGRELESGTAELAWTQSVSPARWLAAKLAVPALLLMAGTLAITLLLRMLWSSSQNSLGRFQSWYEWYDDGVFEVNGPVATAHVLAALALGVLAGLLLRRALPALGVAVLAVASLVYLLDELRPHLWPTTAMVTSVEDTPDLPGLFVEGGALTATGARVPVPDCWGEPTCPAESGITGLYTVYHPSSHFWPLQLMESGIALAVAALAVAAAFWLLRRRAGATA